MKNIHRLLVLFALNEITKCEVRDTKLWSNNEPGNTWSNSINNDQSSNTWNKKEENKNSWKNDHPHNYDTEYRDHNVGYGYHIRNGDAEVWVHSYPSNKNSWSNNHKQTESQQNNNGWSQVQSSWNTPQGSQPEPYFYPRPSQPLTTETNMSSTTTVSSTSPEPVENVEQYVPQTNFYSQNEPNKGQSSFEQFPVIDLMKDQGNSPQKEVMESKPQEYVMSLPINALPAASFTQSNSGFNIGHQNFVQLPFQQAYKQSPNIQSGPVSNNIQQNLGAFQNFQQNNPYLPFNNQPQANFPGVNSQQNIFGNINAPQGLSNNLFNVKNINPFAEILPPFNSNRPNENGPIKTETTLPVQGNLQNVFNSPPIPASFLDTQRFTLQPVNNGIPENNKQGNIQILNSPPLIQVPVSQNSQQPTFDNHLSIQSKIPVVFQPNSPQPQQFLLQNSFVPQFNSLQELRNVNAHPGYNYGPNGFPWMNFNAVQQIPVDSDVSSNKVRRSYDVKEDVSDLIYNLINRPWFNGHGYGYANNDAKSIDTTHKSEDVNVGTVLENVESTTAKDMNMFNDKISSNVAKNDTKIVDLE